MDKYDNHQSLTTLKEMILDERKLVTYISLSKEMCIHVNESKSLLIQIVDELRKSKSTDINLNVNYVISGLLENNKALTSVCNETELEALRNKFKTVFYQHLYSVSAGTPSTDSVSFMAINKFEDFPLCTGLIKSDLCIKRSSDEICSLKTNSQEIVVKDQKPIIKDIKKVKEETRIQSNNVTDTKQKVKTQEIKSESVIKSETATPKKELINNNAQKTDHKNNKAQKGIAGFFNKPPASTNKKMNGNTTVVSASKDNIKKDKPDLQEDNTKIKEEKMDVDEDVPKKVLPEKVNTNSNQRDNKSKNKSSLNQIKKTAKVDKKRKRVLHVSDSESEDEKNDPFVDDEPAIDHESDDEIPPTPLVNTVKITSGILNPKKRRKIVDKTYTDEDGYILTKKEEVYESCSDNEEEVHLKENIQQVNKITKEISQPQKKTDTKKKKMASPQKGKQSTLMSFFKKV